MGEPPCDLLAAELALDRLEAELASELPGHMRAFARAHAAGQPAPPAPAAARRPGSLAVARRALAHPLLADRALVLLRLVAPLVIEADPAVTTARAASPTWESLAVLTSARDAALGEGRFVELIHELHLSADHCDVARAAFPMSAEADDRVLARVRASEHARPARPADAEADVRPSGIDPRLPLAGWHDRERPIDRAEIDRVAGVLASRHGVSGALHIVETTAARPRAFIVEPGREAIIVVPAVVDTPAARFAVLHELGHALAALAARTPLPRAVDEAAASYLARLLESDASLPGWSTPLAAPARARRTATAALLDRIERALPAITDRPVERPPWALWHDPGAQAAYVAAEQLADRWGEGFRLSSLRR